MLLSFSVQNFRSIREEQTLSMARSRRIAAHQPDGSARTPVNTVAGIYGSNASGKSNVLLALQSMADAVRNSHSRWPPEGGTSFDPFKLDRHHPGSPSRFEADIHHKGGRFQYGFELDSDRILREWLYAYPKGRRQTWFERDAESSEEWYFGKGMGGQNRVISELTRPNSLFLSAAAAAKHDKLADLYGWFSSYLRFASETNFRARLEFTFNEIDKSPQTAEMLTKLLKVADLGICGIAVKKDDHSPEDRDRVIQIAKELVGRQELPAVPPDQEIDKMLSQLSTTIELQHTSGEEDHTIGLPFDSESMGTRSLIALGGPVLQALRLGHTLVVDEVDTSLHPCLVAELVQLFNSPETNPEGAQLIFSSHDTSLLGNLVGDEPVLERDQTWFIEKDHSGASVLYPLTDFSPRKQENLERGYLQGRYGAVPFIRTLELIPNTRRGEDGA
jgi:AAA15 family ATPase/GTPase